MTASSTTSPAGRKRAVPTSPTDAPPRERRSYRSPRRQEQAAQTRVAVLQAATRLFGERGWAATGMRDVAREAGVSVETVYGGFRTKSDLLMAAIDYAVVGDDEPVPLNQRPEFAALGQGDQGQRFHAAARLIGDIHRRTAGVNLALREAAASDARLDQLMREREEGRRENVAQGLALVLDRPIAADEADAIWAIVDTGGYRLLRDLRGWSDEQYEGWLAQTLATLLGHVEPATRPQEGQR